MSKQIYPEWVDKQLAFWNERAHSQKGTGVVPFRKLEIHFIARWIWGCKILDAGCGLGELLIFLDQRFSHLTLFGFDFSGEMVRLAQEKAQNIVQMNMLYLGFKDKSFDTIFILRSLKNLLDPIAQQESLEQLSRASSRRVIIIDSFEGLSTSSLSYNLYLSRETIMRTMVQQGYKLVWEEYFNPSLLRFPILGSMRISKKNSDEGFLVFDRKGRSIAEILLWRIDEIKLSLISAIKDTRRLMWR